jgi:hypothetical protein
MSTIINATTTNGVVIQPDNSGSLQLATNSGTTALTIDTSQNVGIGTTSPTSKLDIYKDGAPAASGNMNTGVLVASAAGSYAINIGANSSGGYTWINSAYQNNSGVASPMAFFTGATERMRIDSTGNVSITQTPGKYTIDTSGGATSIANGGTVDFPSASGMLVANNQSGTGAVTIYLCGGGNTSAVSNVGTQVGTFAYNAGINGYRWTNNVGSTATFGFFFVRTRNAA